MLLRYLTEGKRGTCPPAAPLRPRARRAGNKLLCSFWSTTANSERLLHRKEIPVLQRGAGEPDPRQSQVLGVNGPRPAPASSSSPDGASAAPRPLVHEP